MSFSSDFADKKTQNCRTSNSPTAEVDFRVFALGTTIKGVIRRTFDTVLTHTKTLFSICGTVGGFRYISNRDGVARARFGATKAQTGVC